MINVEVLEFTPSDPSGRKSGLLGWLRLKLNDSFIVDGATLRRTLDSRLVLSFPERRDRSGRRRSYVRPLDNAARRHVERQVLRQLGLEENVAS